jgi:hypothetical protein
MLSGHDERPPLAEHTDPVGYGPIVSLSSRSVGHMRGGLLGTPWTGPQRQFARCCGVNPATTP